MKKLANLAIFGGMLGVALFLKVACTFYDWLDNLNIPWFAQMAERAAQDVDKIVKL